MAKKEGRATGLSLNRYQEMAGETAHFHQAEDSHWDDVVYCTLGLAGEAGEVANKVKKVFRDDKKVFREEKVSAIIDELGDCLWYLAEAAENLGMTLEEVAWRNYEKLQSRKERGKLGGDGDNR